MNSLFFLRHRTRILIQSRLSFTYLVAQLFSKRSVVIQQWLNAAFGDLKSLDFGDCNDVGVSRLAGEQRHLAEKVAGLEFRHLLPVSVASRQPNFDLSFSNNEHRIAGIASAQDHFARSIKRSDCRPPDRFLLLG